MKGKEEEREGDPFDRQRCVEGWDQAKVGAQRCLVLGVGAVGSAFALALARLGVQAIWLVDYDVVECSNLNRQVLFGPDDVGAPKAEAAKRNLERYHHVARADSSGFRTAITAHAWDVMTEWPKVVALARQATVIFDAVDIGGNYDFAVFELARRLGIPCVTASSYGWQTVSEFFAAKPNVGSFSLQPPADPTIAERLGGPGLLEESSLAFVGVDQKPPTRLLGSSVFVALMGPLQAASLWVQDLCGGAPTPNFIKTDHNRPQSPPLIFDHPSL